MIERRKLPPNVKIDCPNLDLYYVTVKDFDTAAVATFASDCQKVLSNGQQFLPIVIDSYGGEVYSLFAMVNFLEGLNVPVVTYCNSKAMSCGAVLFSCGQKRIVSPLATLLIHDVATHIWGKILDVTNDVKHTELLQRRAFDLLDRNTGHEKGYWKKLLDEKNHVDLFLTSTQAKQHGLATDIGTIEVETQVILDRRLVLNGETVELK